MLCGALQVRSRTDSLFRRAPALPPAARAELRRPQPGPGLRRERARLGYVRSGGLRGCGLAFGFRAGGSAVVALAAALTGFCRSLWCATASHGRGPRDWVRGPRVPAVLGRVGAGAGGPGAPRGPGCAGPRSRVGAPGGSVRRRCQRVGRGECCGGVASPPVLRRAVICVSFASNHPPAKSADRPPAARRPPAGRPLASRRPTQRPPDPPPRRPRKRSAPSPSPASLNAEASLGPVKRRSLSVRPSSPEQTPSPQRFRRSSRWTRPPSGSQPRLSSNWNRNRNRNCSTGHSGSVCSQRRRRANTPGAALPGAALPAAPARERLQAASLPWLLLFCF